jgi:hypothetical protein
MDPLDAFFGEPKKLHLTPQDRQECREMLLKAVRATPAVRQRQIMDTTLPSLAASRRYELTDDERIDMRRAIMAHCERHPVHCAERSLGLTWLLRLASATASVGVLVSTGVAALAFAAESSIPGDSLYSFKIGVTEPIIGAFARRSSDADVRWQLRQMERRLFEAERMALTAGTDVERRALLAKHIEDQGRLTERLLERARDFSDPAEANAYRHDLEVILNDHAALLTAVAARAPENEPEMVAFAERLEREQESTAALQVHVAALAAPLEQAMKISADAERMQNDIHRLRKVPQDTDGANEVRLDLRLMQRELDAMTQALEAGNLSQAESLLRASRKRAREFTSTVAAKIDPPPSEPANNEGDVSVGLTTVLATKSAFSSSPSSASGGSVSSSSASSSLEIGLPVVE